MDAPLIVEAADILVVRITSDETRAGLWSLTLSSANIPHRVIRGGMTGTAFELRVQAIDYELAERAIDDYERENRPEPRARAWPEAPPLGGRTWSAFALSLLLFAFYYVTGPRGAGSPWFERGAATASAILHGEWWRTVTALTLHSNAAHVFANAVACALFGTLLFRLVGTGMGATLTLLTGASGNLLNALLHRSNHSSVGFSTAIFGMVGLLGALGFMRRRAGARPAARVSAWIAIAASLGILAMLGAGTDKDIDLGAHLFGFLSGIALGFVAHGLLPRARSAWAQAALLSLSLFALFVCWVLAGAAHF